MASLRCVFIYLCWCFFVNCDVLQESASNISESHSSEIITVLDYLNSSPFKVYNYKEATLLNAHTKADITELILDVNVDCINKYPDVPCNEKFVICNAFVRNTPGEGIQVLNNVICKPKPEIIVDESTYDSFTSSAEVEANESKTIALSNEAVSTEVGEHFVAVRKDSVPCLGCPFDLNPNAEGVDELIDIALEHIETERPKKQALVKVLKLQQQVVSGVKYILTAEFTPTICAKDPYLSSESCPRDPQAEINICEITYLHKPWISKTKHVIKNNCTVSQEYVKHDLRKNDMNNEIDLSGKRTKSTDVPNFDKIAENGAIEEMTPSRLMDLESQIIVENEPTHKVSSRKNVDDMRLPSTVAQTINQPDIGTRFQIPTEMLSFESSTAEDFEVTPSTDEEPSRLRRDESSEENKAVEDETSNSENKLNYTIAVNSSEENSSEEKPKQKRAIEDDDDERTKRSVESVESIETKSNTQAANSSEENSDEEKPKQKRAIRQMEKISPDEKGLVKNLADFAANALDSIDDDNNKRIILQILGAKKMVGDDGVYYHIIMRMGVSHCLEDSPLTSYENCKEKLFENYTKICKVQVYVNDDFGSRKVVKSQCQNIKRDKNDNNRTNYSRFKRENFMEATSSKTKRQIPGGESPVSKDNKFVVEYLEAALSQLDAQSNHDNKFKLHEFISATSQIVSGHIYRIKANVILSDCKKTSTTERAQCDALKNAEPKSCSFEVFEQTWVPNSRQIKAKCDNERRKRETPPGGIKQIDKGSENVKKYVREGLINLNTHLTTNNKVKPVEVVSASIQVVQGTIHRIKIKISESDCSKNDQKDFEECNILEGASPKLCELEVWDKPWEGFRRYTVTCEGGHKQYQFTVNPESHNDDQNKRTKRELLVGGARQIDTGNEEIKEYVREGLTQLNNQRASNNKVKPVEILSASVQVVAGTSHKIRVKVSETDCLKNDEKDFDECNVLEGASPKVCDLKVWSKSWENFRQYTIDCEGEKQYQFTLNQKRRSKRAKKTKRQTLAGGINQIDKGNENVKEYIREGLSHLNTQLTSNNKVKPVEVLSASVQVVAGTLHRIKVKISETDCLKNDQKDFEKCNVLEGAAPKVCELKIWDKPWENFRQYTITCEGDKKYEFTLNPKNRSKRQILGGEFPVSKDDEYVIKYLERGLDNLDSESNHENKLKVHEVISATSQIVAGHIYHIKARVILSDCKKTVTVDRGQCGTLKGAEPKTCDFKTFEAPWIPNSLETNITCGDEHYTFRDKRTLEYSPNTGFLGRDDRKYHFALFTDFIKKYNKKYNKEHYKYRFKVFVNNLMQIRTLNTYEQGTATYGITRFTDMTQKEFSRSLGLRTDLKNENETPFAQAKIPDIELPTQFDWRKKGAVTEVKDQQQCGSCWAFSVTGNVEGQYAIKHQKLMEFSEQELVDCDTEDQGCNGGLMDTAYRMIEKMGGLETEQDYPYDAEDEKCHFNRSLARVQLTGALNISNNETDMAKWLVANGPISIAINANAMQFYMGGVSHPFKFLCSPKNLDHGVLIVGYGVHNYPLFKKSLPYWIVKNSWGKGWGEQGYYRVYRGDGTCGLNQMPSSAIVA